MTIDSIAKDSIILALMTVIWNKVDRRAWEMLADRAATLSVVSLLLFQVVYRRVKVRIFTL